MTSEVLAPFHRQITVHFSSFSVRCVLKSFVHSSHWIVPFLTDLWEFFPKCFLLHF